MDKLKDMQLFCDVVDRGSFASAAKKLGVTPAIVGRRIANLEESLGFVLLNRTTRKMLLTPGGKAYYEGARKIIESVVELEDALGTEHQVNPGGIIRLSAPDGLGSPLLVSAIKMFRERYPNIRFDLLLDNNHVDIVGSAIDLAFRFSFDLQDSSYIATKFGETTFGLYASPDYLMLHGSPKEFSDLKQHCCIHMGANRYGDYWNLLVEGKRVSYRQPWDLVVSNTQCCLKAIKEGMGIGLVPTLFVKEELANEQLVELTELSSFPAIGIYGLYPTRKHLPARLRLFIEFLKEWLSPQLCS